MGDMNRTLRDAFDRWKCALIEQDKQTTQAARHRAHARLTSMEDLIAETPADDIEGIGIKLALYVYMSGVDPETADSAVEQVLAAYKDCRRVLGRDPLVEVKGLMQRGNRACERIACCNATRAASVGALISCAASVRRATVASADSW